MSETGNPFFDRPILNSPYEYPKRYWELDDDGQPTQRVLELRRPASFITPIPKAKTQKGTPVEQAFVFDEGKGLSTEGQQYDPTSVINRVRRRVDEWRVRPDPRDWRVTPETERLLKHWRSHPYSHIRPFFCQIEAVETLIWLTEVAPTGTAEERRFLEYLQRANSEARGGQLVGRCRAWGGEHRPAPGAASVKPNPLPECRRGPDLNGGGRARGARARSSRTSGSPGNGLAGSSGP